MAELMMLSIEVAQEEDDTFAARFSARVGGTPLTGEIAHASPAAVLRFTHEAGEAIVEAAEAVGDRAAVTLAMVLS